jgi:galactonate dehydratase
MQPLPISIRRQRLTAAWIPQAVAAAASGSVRDLAVADVTWFPVREPDSGRRYSVIRVRTASGLQGWGECVPLTEAEFQAGSAALKGHAATAVEPVRAALATYPAFQAAANIALLDIAARAARVPIYQFLGGPTRNKARAMAAIGDDPKLDLQERVRQAGAQGYRAFSVPAPAPSAMNHGKAYLNEVRLRMDQLRETAGETADFVLDGNSLLSPGDASSVAGLCERDYLLWLDRPCALNNLRAIRKITGESVTPVGFGHEIQHAGGFQDLLREDAVDVLRPSIGRNGITAIRKMGASGRNVLRGCRPAS